MNELLEYLELNGKREREEKIERYKQLNKYANKGQIVFAGSSLAEQFPINELLQNIDSRYIIYNRGISGDKTDNLIQDLDTCIFDLSPSKLFINIGSNDIGSETYEEDVLISKYRIILDKVKLYLPDTLVYLMSYYPVNPYKKCHIDETAKAKLFETRNNKSIVNANKRIMLLAGEYEFTYIDVFSELLDEEGNLNEAYTIEGIHMWPIAYKKVLDTLQKYF